MGDFDYGKHIERYGGEIVNVVRHLKLCDDVVYRTVFKHNPVAAGKLLSIIMEREVKIEEVDTQAFQPMIELRSAIFDMYAREEDGGVFISEMQKEKRGDEIERSRFCEAIASTGMLCRGASFGIMLPITVIFFVGGDVLGDGRPIYIVDMVERFSKRIVDKLGLQFIFINLHAKPDGSPLSNLVEDLQCDIPSNMHYDWIRELYDWGLDPLKGVFEKMCDAVEKYAAKKSAEASAEAEANTNRNTARRMLTIGKYSHDEISLVSTLSLTEVDKLAISMGL